MGVANHPIEMVQSHRAGDGTPQADRIVESCLLLGLQQGELRVPAHVADRVRGIDPRQPFAQLGAVVLDCGVELASVRRMTRDERDLVVDGECRLRSAHLRAAGKLRLPVI